MQRKNTAKQSYEKLTQRLAKSLEQVNKLTETTPTPQYSSAPDPNILKNLLEECEDSDFWQNFKFLLENAKAANIYQPVDYKKKPKEYCGMKINDNPYYDLV